MIVFLREVNHPVNRLLSTRGEKVGILAHSNRRIFSMQALPFSTSRNCIGKVLCDNLNTGHTCIRHRVCTSLRNDSGDGSISGKTACIRHRVCTSLRIEHCPACNADRVLHTPSRMHFIEEDIVLC